MAERYYRKDFVEAEFEQGLGWSVRRYDVASDEWSDHILIPEDVFKQFFIKEDSNAKYQQEASAHDGGSSAQSELREESRNPSESGEGIQQGRPKSEAPGAKGQVAVAYAVTVDGFIAIKHKVIHNPRSPFIVWMSEEQWSKLANCASEQGLFYIPRTDTIDSPAVLRALVANT